MGLRLTNSQSLRKPQVKPLSATPFLEGNFQFVIAIASLSTGPMQF